VTPLKEAEGEARSAQAYLQSIVDTVREPLIVLDADLRIRSANGSYYKTFRVDPRGTEGRRLAELGRGQWDEPRLREGLVRALNEGEALDDMELGADFEHLGRRTMRLSARRVEGMPFVLLAIEDITERRRLEAEVLEIASAEQRRIGQELHDDAGQLLTGLGLMARVLADRVEATSPEHRIAARIVDGIGEVLDRIRGVVKGLIPVEVDVDGLMAALADLAFQTNELDGIACRFDCAEPVTVPDNTTATQLYRIAQEAVTNAVRHGRPRNIRIALGRDAGRIHLSIRDDGQGLPEPLDEHVGHGLRIMRYRAGLVGASLSIGRAREGGTEVRCVFSGDDDHVE
jgi:PAS domain S-box-containing protein